MASPSLEDDVETIVEEKIEEIERERRSARISRRGALGLAGLVGLGAVGAGSQSVAAVEDHTLEEHLDCNGYDLQDVNFIRAAHNFSSYISRGNGNGVLQLYDGEAEQPFLRARENPDEPGAGSVKFNAAIRGMPESETGGDFTPGPLRIVDDVDVDGNGLQNVGTIAGDVTDGELLESLAGDNIAISNGQLNAAGGEISDDLENRLDDAITRLEVVGGTANQWRAGPTMPAGDYHGHGPWGIWLETDRSAYLGECTIDAEEAGQFSPALYEYDDGEDVLVEQVDSITIQATGGPQTIFLDFLIDEPGTYLLTRLTPEEDDGETESDTPDDLWKPEDDPINLRRTDSGYGDVFADGSRNGVSLEGGYSPYAGGGEPNDRWYYYFDLEISSADSA